MATEAFTYSNGDLGTVSSSAWTGNLTQSATGNDSGRVVSNTFRVGDNNQTFCCHRFATSIGVADHFVEIAWTQIATSNYSEIGVFSRMPSSGTTMAGIYAYVGNDGTAGLVPCTAGTFGANIDSASGLTTTGTHTLRLESEGNNHRVLWDGVEIMSGTSSSGATNTHCGIGGYTDAGATALVSADDWEADELEAAQDANVNATVVTATATVPAPTVTLGSVATPTVVTATATVPAPAVVAGVQVVATVVTASANVPASTITTGATAIPTVVTATGNVPSPTVQAGSNANPSPTVVTATVSVPAPAVVAGVQVVATVVTATVTTVAPTQVRVGSTAIPNVVTATASVPAPVATANNFPFPASVSGRKLLDQNGDVFLLFSMSSWGMTIESEATISQALDDLVTLGFNGATVWIGGGSDLGTDWEAYENRAGEDWWTGTPWASSFGDAWDRVDFVCAEALERGIVVSLSLAGGFFSSAETDWGSVTNGNMTTVGTTVATRYGGYPNVLWHVMFDDPISGTTAARINAYFSGINSVDGTDRVRWCEPQNQSYVKDEVIDAGTMSNFATSTLMDGWYDNGFNDNQWANCVENAEAAYASDTSRPTGNTEAFYDGSPLIDIGNPGQQLREQLCATFIEGGMYGNFTHERWWVFGDLDTSGWIASTESIVWQDVVTHSHQLQQSLCWALIQEHVADLSWVPDDGTLVTAGIGSGNTKAAAGYSDTAALVYKPNTNSLTVNLSVFSGEYATARVRWFDPTDGTYDAVGLFATSGSQVIAHNGSNADGQADWILVIDEDSGSVLVEATVVTATASVVAPVPHAGVGVSAPAVTATAAAPAPTSVRTGAGAAPSVVTATAAVIAPTTVATGVTVTATVVTISGSVQNPSVVAGGGAAVSPTVVTASVSVVAPTPGSGVGVSPDVVTALGNIPTPALGTGMTVTADVVTMAAGVLAAFVVAGLIDLPEDRTTTVPFDDRTTTVLPEDRTTRIPGP